MVKDEKELLKETLELLYRCKTGEISRKDALAQNSIIGNAKGLFALIYMKERLGLNQIILEEPKKQLNNFPKAY